MQTLQAHSSWAGKQCTAALHSVVTLGPRHIQQGGSAEVWGPTYPVYIVLKSAGQVQVDDMPNALDIQPSACHICCNKYLHHKSADS